MDMPHLTVAVCCIKNDQMLMVQEIENGLECWNQPAGHVENGENIIDAALRETLEETGYKVNLTGIQGFYQGVHSETGIHYARVAFTAEMIEKVTDQLDSDIIQTQWLPIQSLNDGKYQLRSEITRQTLEDSTLGPIYPLSIIRKFVNGEHQ